MDTIDWSKYFDAIYCFHYSGYANRKPVIDAELDRVGILHSGIFRYWYTARTPLDIKIRDMMKPTYPDFYNERAGIVMCLTLAYYMVCNAALQAGYKRILTLEDDITFTQELDYLKDTLDHLPEDWDYIHFDRVLNYRENKRLSTLQPEMYYDSNYTGGYWGTGCVGWSEKALQKAVDILTNEMWPADYVLENRDDDRLIDLKRYVPVGQLAYQNNVGPAYRFIVL